MTDFHDIRLPLRLALGAQGTEVDRSDDDALARAGRRLGEEAAVGVDDHRASGPREGRVVREGRALVRGHDEGVVLDRAAAVDDRPPVGGRRRHPLSGGGFARSRPSTRTVRAAWPGR